MASSDPSGSRRYTFGDDDAAGRRLRLLHEVLAPSSVALLDAWAPAAPARALDLGCGPGHSTALVAARSGARTTVGLDQSAAFVAAAHAAFPALQFSCHDVTVVPFPAGPAQLLFARLVLAHLVDPVVVLRRWAGALPVGGRLLVEETEWIDAPPGVLADYEARVRAVVAHQGAPMTAGPRLASVEDGDGWRVLENAVRPLPVPVDVAARIYALNLAGWRRDPYAVEHFSGEELDALAAGLDGLAANGRGRTITWGVRHLAIGRDG